MLACSLAIALSMMPPIDTGVVRLPAALETISAALGENLLASPKLENEVVRFRFLTLDRPRIHAEVATALAAEWRKEGDCSRLVPNSTAELKWKTEELAKAELMLKKELHRHRSPNLEKRWGEGDRSALLEVEPHLAAHRTPMGRLSSRLLDTLDLKRLWAIPPGERRVFAQNPIGGQLAFGPGSQRWLQSFEREQTAFAQMVADLSGENKRASLLQRAVFKDGSGQSPGTYQAQLRATRFSNTYLPVITYIWTRDGTDAGTIPNDWLLDRVDSEISPRAAWMEQPLPEIPEALALASLVRGGPPNPRGRPIQDLLARDPIAVVTEPWLDHFAPLDRELAAVFADDAVGRGIDNLMGTHSLGNLASACMRVHEATESSGIVRIKPLLPWTTRQTRASRGELAKLLTILRQRRPTLEDVCQYAVRQSDGAALSYFEGAAMRLCGIESVRWDVMRGLASVASGDRDGYKLNASFTPAQFIALRNGWALSGSELLPAQRVILSRIVFRRETSLTPPRIPSDTPRRRLNGWMAQNPWNLFPLGLPPETTVRMEVVETPVLFEEDKGRTGRAWEAASLGYVFYRQKDRGEWLDGSGGHVDVERTRFLPGLQFAYRFEAKLSNDLAYFFELYDDRLDPSAAPVKWPNFPPAHKAEFERTLKHYRGNGPEPPARRDPPGLARRN